MLTCDDSSLTRGLMSAKYMCQDLGTASSQFMLVDTSTVQCKFPLQQVLELECRPNLSLPCNGQS